jgi:hypothetical protein
MHKIFIISILTFSASTGFAAEQPIEPDQQQDDVGRQEAPPAEAEREPVYSRVTRRLYGAPTSYLRDFFDEDV